MRRSRCPASGSRVRGGKVEVQGYGFANVEHQVPVTTETIFQSGSIGKQFTAAAVMLSVEDGKLGLEDPIASIRPDAPPALAPHHGAATCSTTPPASRTTGESDFDYRRDYTEDELRKLAFGLELEFPARGGATATPATRCSASSTPGVGPLLRRPPPERVFAPLRMTTARVISEADIIPNRAAGYELVNGELENQEWVSPQLNTTADGALYLIHDLVRWDRGLRRTARAEPESWERSSRP